MGFPNEIEVIGPALIRSIQKTSRNWKSKILMYPSSPPVTTYLLFTVVTNVMGALCALTNLTAAFCPFGKFSDRLFKDLSAQISKSPSCVPVMTVEVVGMNAETLNPAGSLFSPLLK